MKVIFTVRNTGNGRVKISTDYKCESLDTPRIHNLCMSIKDELDKFTDDYARIKITTGRVIPLEDDKG